MPMRSWEKLRWVFGCNCQSTVQLDSLILVARRRVGKPREWFPLSPQFWKETEIWGHGGIAAHFLQQVASCERQTVECGWTFSYANPLVTLSRSFSPIHPCANIQSEIRRKKGTLLCFSLNVSKSLGPMVAVLVCRFNSRITLLWKARRLGAITSGPP